MEAILEFIYLLFQKLSPIGENNFIYVLQLSICLFGGLIITYSHSFFGFSWLRSRLHFYVGIILPCIGLTITTVIGSNIALSLGMIGALSIIRFRTPVRSPYELVHYFSLLTVGIAAKANLYIATILILLLVILPHVLVVLYKTKVGEILSFKSKKNSHDHLITLNFSGLKKYEDIEKLLKDSNIMNISINKNSKNLIKFNGQSVFKDENLKNKFLSEYSNLFNNYDVEREKNINFY